ncbi:inhibitor of KinA sporulation pathway (predicted exonuclease) [Rhodopirellula rubra]|uniref:Inhibitor of KinA sporulation pathway (Predicted exonuclease) n=1 Tax=Aporhodopirellula rubra TaxID=980271 RepID=A0A7W5H4F3_9BACT|nr:3'-5' exonuclease [Aporhodopirellula rubra]MBB3204771.1 inhibitor of KinA sporulation pathway (predicted exonuclease) [Aporhodopirellula rubra]
MARKLDQILVIDVESTCWDGPPPAGETSEIIEIGLCPLDVASLSRSSKHSILVAPKLSSISGFCTELTTLTPDMFAGAGALADAVRRLKKEFESKDRAWASWGDYDRRQFERCCHTADVGYPFSPTHLNVKSWFAVTMGLPHEVGLDTACQKIGIEMEGTHHRGDDDAWNIAGVLGQLLQNSRSPLS